MIVSAQRDTALTRNQSLVLEALADAKGPLTAYAILDQLRDRGMRAPPCRAGALLALCIIRRAGGGVVAPVRSTADVGGAGGGA